MSGIKEKIENNPVVWVLGTLLAGFLSGIATYQTALQIMSLETISKDRLKALEQASTSHSGGGGQTQQPLPAYLDKKEVDALLEKARLAFNERDVRKLYSMLGPMARAQVSEEAATKQMSPLFEALGKLESGFFVQHAFLGQQGLYRSYMLSYFATYEKAKRGSVTMGVIDDGSSYQVFSMSFNAM